MNFCPSCELKIQDTIKIYERENQNLQHLLKFKDMAIKKRDEMIMHYSEEINNLKESIKQTEKYIYRLELQIPDPKINFQTKEAVFQSEKVRTRPQSSMPALGKVKLNNNGSNPNKDVTPLLKPKRIIDAEENFSSNPNPSKTQSLFLDKAGRSIMLFDDDKQKILKNQKFKQLEEFFFNPDNISYLLLFEASKSATKIDLLETMASLLNDFKTAIHLTYRIKTLMKSEQIIASSLKMDDIFVSLRIEICQNLQCDKANVFILDEDNKELWSKTNKAGSNLRVPINKGILGYVVTNNTTIKINDAETDSRFSKDDDLVDNYKIKTMLCLPIRDKEEKIIGVMQAINKTNDYFTPDDEGILNLLSMHGGLMVKNGMTYEKTFSTQYKLYKLMDISVTLFDSLSFKGLLLNGERKLKELMNANNAAIFVKINEHFQRYFENQPLITYPFTGIIGEAATKGIFVEVADPNSHTTYNHIIDIQTNLPLYTYPIKSSDKQVLGVCQFIKINDIFGKKDRSNDYQHDFMIFFLKILGYCMEKLGNFKEYNL